MTAPRPVYPDRYIFITRRCTQRQFLLRPDDETNNAFVYILGEASKRFGMQTILSQMMSNHHHTVLYDAEGRHVEFRQYLHNYLAKVQNAHWGRWENLWATEEPCTVEVLTRSDLLDKLVYVATNPVKDGLVEKVHQWPGPNFLAALLNGKRMRAHRPRHFFRDDGPMPESIDLELKLPDHFEDKQAFLDELRCRVADVERAFAIERQKSGCRVVGRRTVLRQSWRDCPTSREPRRTLRPRVASRNVWMRIAALQRNKEWEREYREARARWKRGEAVEFPFGTYWLQRFAHVRVAPPQPHN
jgi:REP element-mobilizing transposase RayT